MKIMSDKHFVKVEFQQMLLGVQISLVRFQKIALAVMNVS